MSWWTGKRLAIALVASLALNLFLAGTLGAILATGDGDRHRPRGPFDLRGASYEVSRESREQIRALWRQNRDEIRPKFRALHDSRRRVRDLLTAEGEIDRAALDAAMAELHRNSTEVHTALYRFMLRVGDRLSPEERRRFFRAALHEPRHRRHRGEHRERRERDRDDD